MSDEVWRYRRGLLVMILAAAVVAIVVVLLLLPSDPASNVDWENYEAGLQQEIEQLAEAGDCAVLETIRQEAEVAEAEQIEATGTGNEDLIRYIDSELNSTDCVN
jgi:hypothetical protein